MKRFSNCYPRGFSYLSLCFTLIENSLGSYFCLFRWLQFFFCELFSSSVTYCLPLRFRLDHLSPSPASLNQIVRFPSGFFEFYYILFNVFHLLCTCRKSKVSSREKWMIILPLNMIISSNVHNIGYEERRLISDVSLFP